MAEKQLVFAQALETRDSSRRRLADAAREFAAANARRRRTYFGLTLNEERTLALLRQRLIEFDEATADLRTKEAA